RSWDGRPSAVAFDAGGLRGLQPDRGVQRKPTGTCPTGRSFQYLDEGRDVRESGRPPGGRWARHDRRWPPTARPDVLLSVGPTLELVHRSASGQPALLVFDGSAGRSG